MVKQIKFCQTQRKEPTKQFPFLYHVADCEFFSNDVEMVLLEKDHHHCSIQKYLKFYGTVLSDTDLSPFFQTIKRPAGKSFVDFRYLSFDELKKIAEEVEEA